MDRDTPFDKLTGKIESVIYQNAENGYTVFRMKCDDEQRVTVVGFIPGAMTGERIDALGSWVSHPVHGGQFKAVSTERQLPKGSEAIYELLASRSVKGVGPATALMLVTKFGDETLEVIESSPELLATVKGISADKAREISRDFTAKLGLRRTMELLHKHEIEPEYALRLHSLYGSGAVEALRANPYILADEIIGADFKEADALALRLGFEGDSPERVSSALIFELRHNAENGHSFIPREKLVGVTSDLISVDAENIDEAIDMLVECGDVVLDEVSGQEAVYLPELHACEAYVAQRIAEMAGVRKRASDEDMRHIEDISSSEWLQATDDQRNALIAALERDILVITGGPGVGKTSTVRLILRLFGRRGLKTYLTAPTGRAAKRMGDVAESEAFTVHRLLEAGYSTGREVAFQRDESDPLDCNAVILDETSMVDITLICALLRALPEGCKLILVGDCDQLPPIGPGNVFSDIIRSEIVETVYLTEIFRQSGDSSIVKNAHAINRGEILDLTENRGDFFFLRRRDEKSAAELILELCRERLPNRMGIEPEDIQVLSPSRRGVSGSVNLNHRLQEALNPASEGKNELRFGEFVFRQGDRVMQIRNNYDIIWNVLDKNLVGSGIFNGDIGKILSIDTSEGSVRIDFDGRLAIYDYQMLNELEHAYAMTVHKSQGSEYRAVILSAAKCPALLMNRQVLYTAITRAKELLIIVGDNNVVRAMIMDNRQRKRYSGLKKRLTER